MKKMYAAMLTVLLVMAFGEAHSAVLATQKDIINGKHNISLGEFRSAVESRDDVTSAIIALLTDDPERNSAAKAAVMRGIIDAVELISETSGPVPVAAMENLYRALVIYDLMPDKNVFTETENESLKSNIQYILSVSMNGQRFSWDDPRWSVGVDALRITAAAVLYGFVFPEDGTADRYRSDGMRVLENNLMNGIDESGAWIAGSPGLTDDALEYLIVTAKVFRNAGVFDVFSDQRFRSLLTFGMKILPPQQAGPGATDFANAPFGDADPAENRGDIPVWAAADIMPYDSGLPARLMWYWNRLRRPVSPLSILFIDSSIPPVPPRQTSGIAGTGIAVMRNLPQTTIGSPVESVVYAGFGDARGVPDRWGHDHVDHGDFSFIWRGIPLTVHNGFSVDPCTNIFMNRTAWRHNLVLSAGAGDTPVPVDRNYPSSRGTDTVIEGLKNPADMYADGISQFVTTQLVDYVAGPVRLSGLDAQPSSHYRHLLFLKPDAILVWDQIESSFPLEWNIWVPVMKAWSGGNVLHLETEQYVDLQVHFAGDDSLDINVGDIPDEKTWEWPLIVRAPYGEGTMTVSCIDFFNTAVPDSAGLGRAFLGNMLDNTRQGAVGVMGVGQGLASALTALGRESEDVDPSTLSLEDLNRFAAIIIDSKLTAVEESAFVAGAWKLAEFVAGGGTLFIVASEMLPDLYERVSGPGLLPYSLGLGSCPVGIGGGESTVNITDDPLLRSPEVITEGAIHAWANGGVSPTDSLDAGFDATVSVPRVIVSWSGRWKVLASTYATFPLLQSNNPMFGTPLRVRVKHPASRDYFALLLPRKSGEPYLFDIKRTEPGYFEFADPTTEWQVRAGPTSWTDANLSVLITSFEGRTLYAFDCTTVTIGGETLVSERPMSIWYNERRNEGRIMSASDNVISGAMADFRIRAGEVVVRNITGSIDLERVSYLTSFTVVDQAGNPLPWASVNVNGRHIGATDDSGKIPVRWLGDPPTVTVSWHGSTAFRGLVPGEVELMLDTTSVR